MFRIYFDILRFISVRLSLVLLQLALRLITNVYYLIYIKYTFNSKLLTFEKFFNIFLNETDRIFYAANSQLLRLDSPFVL